MSTALFRHNMSSQLPALSSTELVRVVGGGWYELINMSPSERSAYMSKTFHEVEDALDKPVSWYRYINMSPSERSARAARMRRRYR